MDADQAWLEIRSRLGMAWPNISKAAPSSSKEDASRAAETHEMATPWKPVEAVAPSLSHTSPQINDNLVTTATASEEPRQANSIQAFK
jgi:hypothetical protein